MDNTKNRLIFICGINKPRLENGNFFSRNYYEKDRVYDSEGICNTITAHCETDQGWYLIKN